MRGRWGLWWGSLEGADLTTLVVAASGAGFREVSCTPAMWFASRAGDADGSALRALLDAHGVRVAMIDPLLRGLPGACDASDVSPRWRSTFEHGEDDCHRAADALDAELINVAHFLGAPTPVEELADAIGAITERAAARGRRVCVEAMPEGSIPDITTAAAIVRAVAHPACGITVDTWHWWRSGGDPAELFALPEGSVFALQLSDAADAVRSSGTEPPSRDRLPMGEGDLPLPDLLRWAATAHPGAHLGLEVFDRRLGGTAHDAVAGSAAASVRRLERRC